MKRSKRTNKGLSKFISRERVRARAGFSPRGGASSTEWKTAKGEFCGSRSGFGFVKVEGVEGDVFIGEDKTLGAIHGDEVEIRYREYTGRSGEKKTEGRVTKILGASERTIIGTLCYEPSYKRSRRRFPSYWYVVADDTRVGMRPIVDNPMDGCEGDKVLVLLKHGGNPMHPECTIVANLGDSMSKEANYDAVLLECGIPTEFSEGELAEAERVAKREVSPDGRADFTKDSILTIDGEGAKDLDDAVSIKKCGTGWRLYVHIADVSSYVGEKTALDRAVMSRGTSVYFTDKVVPMLPPSLSNGACSLNAGEPKSTLSAIMTLSAEGEILKTEVVKSVICSKVRGVYSEVNELFNHTASAEIKEKYKSVSYALSNMKALYEVLAKKSAKRGAMDLEIPEAEIILDEDGTPIDIQRRVRGDAEKMIEQFMLTANEGVARFLTEKGIPCVYRVHACPTVEKMDSLVGYLYNLGLDTRGIDCEGVTTGQLSAILLQAEEKGLGYPVSYSVLRSMAKAEYSEVLSPHFGLGLSTYCHFTSPIRRLSDLATHRIIHRVLLEGRPAKSMSGYAKRASRAATECELRALTAERRITDLYKVIYMSERVGEEFSAMVTSITSFGMFVEPENTCEGLIPISEMPGYFIFDERNMAMRDGQKIYHLGDSVRVRLEEADIVRGKLRYSLLL